MWQNGGDAWSKDGLHMTLDQAAAADAVQWVSDLRWRHHVAPQPGETQAATNPGSGLITFSVPAQAAERIVYASTHGDGGIYMTLVPPDNQPTTIPPVGKGELFQGGLTPYEG